MKSHQANSIKMPKLNWGFIILSFVGMMVCFSLQSLVRYQLIYKYKIINSNFLTFLQLSSYSLSGAYLTYRVTTKQFDVTLHGNNMIIAVLVTIAMLLTNFSSLRLSESTQVLFRSVRLIPLMISNIFIFQKPHPIPVILGVCCMVCALVAFAIDEFSGITKFDMPGIIATMLSICFDSLSSNLIEKSLNAENINLYKIMSNIFGFSFILITIFTSVQGELLHGLQLVIRQPHSLYLILLFTLAGHAGTVILFSIIRRYGCIAGGALISMGKPIVSYIRQPKFTHVTLFSVVLLSFGVMLNIVAVSLDKNEDSDDPENAKQNIVVEFPICDCPDEGEEEEEHLSA